jgi:hypothetical protein
MNVAPAQKWMPANINNLRIGDIHEKIPIPSNLRTKTVSIDYHRTQVSGV